MSGLRRFEDVPLEELVRYIDWMPFFNAWEFAGKFPDILTDPVVGEAASNLYADARRMLKRDRSPGAGRGRAVIGFFPANSVDDDIEVYADESRSRVVHRLHHLRQQKEKPAGQPHFALADFVAPRDSGVPDYIGAFAVTAGIGIDDKVREFEARTTTTAASCSRRWPTASPRRSPSACTSACGASSGAMRPRSASATTS